MELDTAMKLLENPTLGFDEKRAIASRFSGEIRRAVGTLDKKLGTLIESKRQTEARLESVKDVLDWLENVKPVVESNQSSKLHVLKEAVTSGKLYNYDSGNWLEANEIFIGRDPTFLVKHDWDGAIGNGLNIGEHETRLPYPLCFFEFRISGKSVIVWADQFETDGSSVTAMCFIEGKNGYWFTGEAKDKETNSGTYCWKQVLAICVALDAQVATHEVVRAPLGLNRKRARLGKPLLQDCHVVDLTKRYRTNALGNDSERHVRLHFRRGHWRHLETHKTWIKWMLVGDPHLGFVDKRYAL